jgi:hypothetical protein
VSEAYARLMQGTEAGEIQAAGRCIGYAMASECCSAPLEADCKMRGASGLQSAVRTDC